MRKFSCDQIVKGNQINIIESTVNDESMVVLMINYSINNTMLKEGEYVRKIRKIDTGQKEEKKCHTELITKEIII